MNNSTILAPLNSTLWQQAAAFHSGDLGIHNQLSSQLGRQEERGATVGKRAVSTYCCALALQKELGP